MRFHSKRAWTEAEPSLRNLTGEKSKWGRDTVLQIMYIPSCRENKTNQSTPEIENVHLSEIGPS